MPGAKGRERQQPLTLKETAGAEAKGVGAKRPQRHRRPNLDNPGQE